MIPTSLAPSSRAAESARESVSPARERGLAMYPILYHLSHFLDQELHSFWSGGQGIKPVGLPVVCISITVVPRANDAVGISAGWKYFFRGVDIAAVEQLVSLSNQGRL